VALDAAPQRTTNAGGATARPRRSPVDGWGDKARLARFFTRLAIKEHLVPGLPVRPLVAELFLTDNCNLKCVSCACWRTVTRRELTGDEWCGVVDQLADYGILKANFTGGEPLLRSDAPRIMAHAYQRGIRNLHVNTNATLLDDRRREAVLEAGVRSFNISVDGPRAEVHERVRGVPGSFAKTVGNLERVLEQREQLDLRVRMNFTVMRSNVDELPEMMRLAQQLQVQLYLNLATDQTFLFRDGQVGIETRVDSDHIEAAMALVEGQLRTSRRFVPRYSELAYVRRHFQDRLQGNLPCAESQLKVMIHSTGELGGCWGHDATLNVRDTPVAEILGAEDYREEHARFFRKECVGCGSNYALNLAWRPRSYVEDALWRLGKRQLATAGSR
jgi:MoaA/NifB/PqqE/SkfB family radical SAM enzyme